MIIGGFQPFTLSDFPDKVAAIVFSQGCNFRCPYVSVKKGHYCEIQYRGVEPYESRIFGRLVDL